MTGGFEIGWGVALPGRPLSMGREQIIRGKFWDDACVPPCVDAYLIRCLRDCAFVHTREFAIVAKQGAFEALQAPLFIGPQLML